MKELRIAKGGKLIERYWHYDQKKKKGRYKERDVTKSAVSRLFDGCELADDVRLRDIFILLQREMEIYNVIFRNWCEEFVNEGLKGLGKPYTGKYDPEGIEYLELYWHLERDGIWQEKKGESSKTEFELRGIRFPDFHGIGFELREKSTSPMGWPKGDRIPWGVSFSNVSELINIPVKLRKETQIHDDQDWKAPPIAEFDECEYSLGHILYGIIWELSFNGGPKERDKKSDEIKQQMDDIKSGKAKTVPFKLK